jgi:hypothetical protein
MYLFAVLTEKVKRKTIVLAKEGDFYSQETIDGVTDKGLIKAIAELEEYKGNLLDVNPSRTLAVEFLPPTAKPVEEEVISALYLYRSKGKLFTYKELYFFGKDHLKVSSSFWSRKEKLEACIKSGLSRDHKIKITEVLNELKEEYNSYFDGLAFNPHDVKRATRGLSYDILSKFDKEYESMQLETEKEGVF